MASKRHRMSLEQRLRRKKRKDRKVVSLRAAEMKQFERATERQAKEAS